MWLLFQTRANTNPDKMVLINIAVTEIHPDILYRLNPKQKLITKASKGINTAASVKRIVNVSIACKKKSNVISLFLL